MAKFNYRNFMYRSVPMWVLCFSLLAAALFAVALTWAAVSTEKGSTRSGLFGEAALAVAHFPSLARKTLTAITQDAVAPNVFLEIPRQNIALKDFKPIKAKPELEVNGLLAWADETSLTRAAGWRILAGAFVIDGSPRYAALALSPDLVIEHIWILEEEPIGGRTPEYDHRKYLHGVAVLPDASIIYTFDNGISLQRRDQCGDVTWAVGGSFHHAVSLDGSGEFLWTMKDDTGLVKVDTATGKILQNIDLLDVIAANPHKNILGIRQYDDDGMFDNKRNTPLNWYDDRFHLNDIEPLPRELATDFPEFEPGDLLLSSRSLNLIFVLNPETLKIKWWRFGAFRRQHDPDWMPGGLIAVYDNRLGLDHSRITAVDPGTFETRTLVDGRNADFYSRVRGKHQITGPGHFLVTSSQQGRVFEVDAAGKLILDIQNTVPGSPDKNYVVSEALWLPAETLDFSASVPCGG